MAVRQYYRLRSPTFAALTAAEFAAMIGFAPIAEPVVRSAGVFVAGTEAGGVEVPGTAVGAVEVVGRAAGQVVTPGADAGDSYGPGLVLGQIGA